MARSSCRSEGVGRDGSHDSWISSPVKDVTDSPAPGSVDESAVVSIASGTGACSSGGLEPETECTGAGTTPVQSMQRHRGAFFHCALE
eukprot:967674-Prymnesium_polylepis.2